MLVEWNARMQKTAGFCYNRWKVTSPGAKVRSSRIAISTKVDRMFLFLFLNRAQSIYPSCTAAYKLIVQPWNPPPWFRCSYICRQVPPRPYDARDPSRERWKCGRECWPIICLNVDFHVPIRYLLHAANLWHVTYSFTSLPKEGALRIFSPWKILTASAGFGPANLGT